MKTGTAKPKKKPVVESRKPRTIQLLELVNSKPGRIDREAGILYHCKILGLESANGRRYSQAAIAAAVPLYEGRAVNADHPAKPGDQRSVHDRFGWFENVTAEADGLYGDFHLVNPRTELAESLLNAAESKPDLYGFSHNALGEGDEIDGVFVVGRISEVRSVDLVAEPATTKSLFESEQPMKKISLRKLLEWVKPAKPAAQKRLKALLEMPEDEPLDMELDAPADMPVEPPADAGGGMDQLTGALAAIVKEGNHELAAKILRLIKSESEPEVAATEEDDSDDKDEDDEEKETPEAEDEDKEKDKDKMEAIQLRKELDTLKADRSVRQLIEDAGLKFAKPEGRELFIESLLPLDEKKRKALIEERKTLLQESANGHNRPRSQGPGQGSNGAQSRDAQLQKVSSGKELAEALKRR